MNIIAQKDLKHKPYWLLFHLNGNPSDFLEHDLPYPSYLKKINRGYLIGWQIDGYFGTTHGLNFLNDIIARFSITFAENKPQRLPYAPTLNDNKAHINDCTYKLNRFSSTLRSIKTKKYIPQRADNFDDLTFWAIKLHAEDLITEYGILSHEQLEGFAMSQFMHKEKSTIKAKCRAIWNYYDQRDFQLKTRAKTTKTKEELNMSRIDHIKKVHEQRKETSKARIMMLLESKQANEHKKKNGKWNAVSISKFLKMDVRTVRKYIKEITNI